MNTFICINTLLIAFQVLSKLSGAAQGTMQFVTSVLNEWGQFLTTVVVASESEGAYRRLARGLVARFKRAGAPAPKIIYADNNCCRYVSYLSDQTLTFETSGSLIQVRPV